MVRKDEQRHRHITYHGNTAGSRRITFFLQLQQSATIMSKPDQLSGLVGPAQWPSGRVSALGLEAWRSNPS